ncbi:hypothetical protein FQN57_002586 [Myotisia sp. PD_48]|nr:hypothetical protein FQN57_002586 [Myotisia sp. PD_48]
MRGLINYVVFIFALLFANVLAVPVAEPEAIPNPGPGPVPEPSPEAGELVARDASPAVPKGFLPPGLCPPPVQQTNNCQTGIPYCCSTESGKHNCVKSAVNCQQQVICCNNNFGFQMCIGDIDFNMPITINIVL